MQSREENFDDAKQFFIELLDILNCQKIKIEQIQLRGAVYFVCGFSSHNPKILASIASIFPEGKFIHQDINYIIIIASGYIKDKLKNFFRKVIHTLQLPCGGFFEENKYYITIHYKALYTDDKTRLNDAGLGLVEELLHEKYSQPIKMITIDGYSNYKKFIFAIPDSNINSMLCEQAKKIKAKSFCLGLNSREESSLSKLKKNELFDRNIIGKIFEFDTVQGIKYPRDCFGFFNKEEKKANDHSIVQHNHHPSEEQEISEHIETLTAEMGCSCSNTKTIKIQFLQLVLAYKRVNENFSLKVCLEFAKKNEPALYYNAISGILSTRTKDLLDKILGQKKQVPHASLTRWKI